MSIRVLVVDDHPLVRAGLLMALRTAADLEVVGEAGTPEEALELAKSIPLDVAIVDILMPRMSGIALTGELFALQPTCRVLGLSVIAEPALLADMLRAHAVGCALKTQPIDEIVEAIHDVARGTRYLPPTVTHEAVERELETPTARSLGSLTRREREVFELLIRGHSNGDIATTLGISSRTVEAHRAQIGMKLSARSIAQLQRLAALHGDALGR